ncbi:MAG: ATP-binding cassette domain-containing protein [Halieaceae bacterium]|nr:ATP-binding cassette domain-containing protein [Halieaceae bacterium]
MPAPDGAFLHLESLYFSYRALPVLKGINWTWREGEQWACIGPNGAGKTTLAGLLSRQLDWGSGELLRSEALEGGHCSYVCFEQQKSLCDRDKRLDDSEFRSDAHDPGTTVATAIGAELSEATCQQWIDRLGIRHILDRGLRFISTGEMRKTLLLRAILQAPALLILDSPLDGLDRASQQAMREILEQLLATPTRMLLLARSLVDIPAGVSHLLVLDAGEVVAAGPRETVLADPDVQALMAPPQLAFDILPAPAERPYELSIDTPRLELHDVSVSYGDTRVLAGVSWTLGPGQHCNIAGPNGCGKTTLLSLVTGDNHKAYGQDITLFGRRRGSGESVWDIKQKFGQVDTQLHLNYSRGMAVLEVVVSGFFDSLGLYDDWGDKQLEIARAWLRTLGMSELERAPFDTLSFGIQRMVLLARAMVKSPAILILDEPCLGLDRHHTRGILDAVDHIAGHSDTQVVYVSHSVGEMPACINQWLEFVPSDSGFELVQRESA